MKFLGTECQVVSGHVPPGEMMFVGKDENGHPIAICNGKRFRVHFDEVTFRAKDGDPPSLEATYDIRIEELP